MSDARAAVGSFLQIEKLELQALIDTQLLHGYRVIGPCLREAAVVLDDVANVDQLPRGWLDDQDGGCGGAQGWHGDAGGEYCCPG